MLPPLPFPADVLPAPVFTPWRGLLHLPPFDLRGKSRALILFTDATRHAPDALFAEALVRALPLPPESITFLCATGAHRPSTEDEKRAKLGAAILAHHPVHDHEAARAVFVDTLDGLPLWTNPALLDPATFVIATGVVEPHQYAGYSGGYKTAVIGCGGLPTIEATHGVDMLKRDGVRLGAVEGNPFQAFVRAAGARLGVDFILNALMPDDDSLSAVAYGGLEAHDALIGRARALYEIPAPRPAYGLVLAGVPSAKAVNLYQASRAFTYLVLSARPVIRQGGVVLIPAPLAEGAGMGQGERNFYALLERFGGPTPALMRYLESHPAQAGEQRAYMLAQACQGATPLFIGVQDPALLARVGLESAPDLATGYARACALLGEARPSVLAVPDALRYLPQAPTGQN